MKILNILSYKQTTSFTCGPSSYMSIFNKRPNAKDEKLLSNRGSIKPAKIFLGISFLIINPKLKLYIANDEKPFNDNFLKIVYHYEKFEKKYTFLQLKKVLSEYYFTQTKAHAKQIYTIKSSNAIFKLLDSNKRVLFLTNSAYWNKTGWLHWIAYKEKKDDEYIFEDPRIGKHISFSRKDILNQIKMVRESGVPMQLVST